MRDTKLFSHDDVRKLISMALSKAQDGSTDEEFGDSFDASSSAVTTWRNRKADMTSYFLVNAMKRHPDFLAELLFALGYKATALSASEIKDHEFTIALASLQLKRAKALMDGVEDHQELLDMEQELDEVGEGVECRKAKIRRLRVVG